MARTKTPKTRAEISRIYRDRQKEEREEDKADAIKWRRLCHALKQRHDVGAAEVLSLLCGKPVSLSEMPEPALTIRR